ncbi:MAG TPA: GNAT family N-acetyltransferase [Longimicrobium sp.]|jgi:RimJ/RimL family protein N-acetyltransferase|uniref:GNAT family N-acetyltransferase n=1 Tax=Longimicrobium sp. TaxID=2029185 RepID=UPI002ED8E809
MSPTITLRPLTESDMPFLLALYATTREDELRQVDWTPEQKGAFVHQQFWAQHQFWQENYRYTSWDVVLRDGEPIGRLYVARWPEDIRIVDIALVPEHRGGGIGSELIRALFAEGDASGRKVSIHVEMFNPARRLYERMGFVQAGDRGVYLLMERPPAPAEAPV